MLYRPTSFFWFSFPCLYLQGFKLLGLSIVEVKRKLHQQERRTWGKRCVWWPQMNWNDWLLITDIASHWFAFSKVTPPEVNKVKKRFRCFVRFKTCGRYFLFGFIYHFGTQRLCYSVFCFFPRCTGTVLPCRVVKYLFRRFFIGRMWFEEIPAFCDLLNYVHYVFWCYICLEKIAYDGKDSFQWNFVALLFKEDAVSGYI